MRKPKFILSCLASLALIGAVAAPGSINASAEEISVTDTNAVKKGTDTVSPYKSNIYWVYKEFVNGELYKRLYDYDRGIWIGDWIRIR